MVWSIVSCRAVHRVWRMVVAGVVAGARRGGHGARQIADQRTQRTQGGRPLVQAEGGRRCVPLLIEHPRRLVRAEIGRRPRAHRQFQRVRRVCRLRQDQLARAQPLEQRGRFLPQLSLRRGGLPAARFAALVARDLADVALAGRDVGRGQTQRPAPTPPRQLRGGAGRRLPRFEQGRLERRARRDHAHHAAPHQRTRSARLAGIFELLADRDPVPGLDEPRQMLVDRADRHAGQGRAQPAAHRLRGQLDAQLARDQLGVLVERLVEVAQPEEQDRVRVARLHVQVLAPDRRYHLYPTPFPALSSARMIHGSV